MCMGDVQCASPAESEVQMSKWYEVNDTVAGNALDLLYNNYILRPISCIFEQTSDTEIAELQVTRYNRIILRYEFLFLLENICYDPSLEPSQRDGSNDRSQHIWLYRKKRKIDTLLSPLPLLIWSSERAHNTKTTVIQVTRSSYPRGVARRATFLVHPFAPNSQNSEFEANYGQYFLLKRFHRYVNNLCEQKRLRWVSAEAQANLSHPSRSRLTRHH